MFIGECNIKLASQQGSIIPYSSFILKLHLTAKWQEEDCVEGLEG